MDLAIPADHKVKIKENKEKNKYLDLARELKKDMKHEGDGDTSCNWHASNSPQSLNNRAERVGNWIISQDHPNYRSIKISQNIKKSPGDLRRLAVS